MKLRLWWLSSLAVAIALLGSAGTLFDTATAQTPSGDLTIIKRHASESPPGQTPIDFPLIYIWTTGGPGTSVTVTDNLPAEMTFEAADQLTGATPFTITTPAVGSGGTVTFSAASLPAGRSASFRIRGRILPATPLGTVITNTATVASAGVDPNPGNNSSTVTTVVGSAAAGGRTFTFTTSTTLSSHTTPVTRSNTAADAARTRVTAVFSGTTIFDQSVDAAQNSPTELALEEAAKAALRNAAGPQAVINGPAHLGTTRQAADIRSGPVNEFDGETATANGQGTFGPATILIGFDQSQTFFVAAGTINFNSHIHTAEFFSAVTTLTSGFVNVTHLQFTAIAALQPIPQAVQNPAAVAIVSAIGGGPSGSRNPTPVPSRPVATSPAVQTLPSMPTLRPPSTGDAGLVTFRSDS